MSCANEILKKLVTLPANTIEIVKENTRIDEQKIIAKNTLHGLCQVFQYMYFFASILDHAIDDSYEFVEVIRAFVSDNKSKQAPRANIELLSSIFDTLTKKTNIESILSIFCDLQEIVGASKVGEECFDVIMFKVLYKLMMASGLSIV